MTSDTTQPSSNWKSRVYLMGGITGLIVGFLAAYFYARVSEENGTAKPIKTMDTLKLAVSLLSLIRQITDLGVDGSKK